MYTVIDIETENTGSDIMRHNKRIISVQIGNATDQSLYYDDATDPQRSLVSAKTEIESLLSQGYIFAGYNLRNFDLRFLKQFLGIDIPPSNIFDLSDTPQMQNFRDNRIYKLEDVCRECSIEVTHKHLMNRTAESYKTREDIREQARVEAQDVMKKRGWSWDFAFNYVLDKIAGGHAIYDAYKEFVLSGGQLNTLFYEYAMGDVIAEYRLLKALTK